MKMSILIRESFLSTAQLLYAASIALSMLAAFTG